jgi:hypothetical protein
MVQLIESTTVSKTGDVRGNHDGIVVNENYIAVIDAYQARGWRAWDGKPAGIFAKDSIVSEFDALPAGLSATDAVQVLEEQLQVQSARAVESMDDAEVISYPMARLLVYSVALGQIWRLGDSPFVVDGELHRSMSQALQEAVKKRCEVMDHFLKNVRSDLKDLVNNDYGRSAAMDLIVAEEHRVDGVEVLSGRPNVDMDMLLSNIEVFTVEKGQEVILATDGFPHILPTLDESEDWLAAQRARDPLFIKDFQSLRGASDDEAGYDDRSYVRFIVA